MVFERDFDWPRSGPWHTAYKAGMRLNVKRACAEEAIAAAAARAIPAPTRQELADGLEPPARG